MAIQEEDHASVEDSVNHEVESFKGNGSEDVKVNVEDSFVEKVSDVGIQKTVDEALHAEAGALDDSTAESDTKEEVQIAGTKEEVPGVEDPGDEQKSEHDGVAEKSAETVSGSSEREAELVSEPETTAELETSGKVGGDIKEGTKADETEIVERSNEDSEVTPSVEEPDTATKHVEGEVEEFPTSEVKVEDPKADEPVGVSEEVEVGGSVTGESKPEASKEPEESSSSRESAVPVAVKEPEAENKVLASEDGVSESLAEEKPAEHEDEATTLGEESASSPKEATGGEHEETSVDTVPETVKHETTVEGVEGVEGDKEVLVEDAQEVEPAGEERSLTLETGTEEEEKQTEEPVTPAPSTSETVEEEVDAPGETVPAEADINVQESVSKEEEAEVSQPEEASGATKESEADENIEPRSLSVPTESVTPAEEEVGEDVKVDVGEKQKAGVQPEEVPEKQAQTSVAGTSFEEDASVEPGEEVAVEQSEEKEVEVEDVREKPTTSIPDASEEQVEAPVHEASETQAAPDEIEALGAARGGESEHADVETADGAGTAEVELLIQEPETIVEQGAVPPLEASGEPVTKQVDAPGAPVVAEEDTHVDESVVEEEEAVGQLEEGEADENVETRSLSVTEAVDVTQNEEVEEEVGDAKAENVEGVHEEHEQGKDGEVVPEQQGETTVNEEGGRSTPEDDSQAEAGDGEVEVSTNEELAGHVREEQTANEGVLEQQVETSVEEPTAEEPVPGGDDQAGTGEVTVVVEGQSAGKVDELVPGDARDIKVEDISVGEEQEASEQKPEEQNEKPVEGAAIEDEQNEGKEAEVEGVREESEASEQQVTVQEEQGEALELQEAGEEHVEALGEEEHVETEHQKEEAPAPAAPEELETGAEEQVEEAEEGETLKESVTGVAVEDEPVEKEKEEVNADETGALETAKGEDSGHADVEPVQLGDGADVAHTEVAEVTLQEPESVVELDTIPPAEEPVLSTSAEFEAAVKDERAEAEREETTEVQVTSRSVEAPEQPSETAGGEQVIPGGHADVEAGQQSENKEEDQKPGEGETSVEGPEVSAAPAPSAEAQEEVEASGETNANGEPAQPRSAQDGEDEEVPVEEPETADKPAPTEEETSFEAATTTVEEVHVQADDGEVGGAGSSEELTSEPRTSHVVGDVETSEKVDATPTPTEQAVEEVQPGAQGGESLSRSIEEPSPAPTEEAQAGGNAEDTTTVGEAERPEAGEEATPVESQEIIAETKGDVQADVQSGEAEDNITTPDVQASEELLAERRSAEAEENADDTVQQVETVTVKHADVPITEEAKPDIQVREEEAIEGTTQEEVPPNVEPAVEEAQGGESSTRSVSFETPEEPTVEEVAPVAEEDVHSIESPEVPASEAPEGLAEEVESQEDVEGVDEVQGDLVTEDNVNTSDEPAQPEIQPLEQLTVGSVETVLESGSEEKSPDEAEVPQQVETPSSVQHADVQTIEEVEPTREEAALEEVQGGLVTAQPEVQPVEPLTVGSVLGEALVPYSGSEEKGAEEAEVLQQVEIPSSVQHADVQTVEEVEPTREEAAREEVQGGLITEDNVNTSDELAQPEVQLVEQLTVGETSVPYFGSEEKGADEAEVLQQVETPSSVQHVDVQTVEGVEPDTETGEEQVEKVDDTFEEAQAGESLSRSIESFEPAKDIHVDQDTISVIKESESPEELAPETHERVGEPAGEGITPVQSHGEERAQPDVELDGAAKEDVTVRDELLSDVQTGEELLGESVEETAPVPVQAKVEIPMELVETASQVEHADVESVEEAQPNGEVGVEAVGDAAQKAVDGTVVEEARERVDDTTPVTDEPLQTVDVEPIQAQSRELSMDTNLSLAEKPAQLQLDRKEFDTEQPKLETEKVTAEVNPEEAETPKHVDFKEKDVPDEQTKETEAVVDKEETQVEEDKEGEDSSEETTKKNGAEAKPGNIITSTLKGIVAAAVSLTKGTGGGAKPSKKKRLRLKKELAAMEFAA